MDSKDSWVCISMFSKSKASQWLHDKEFILLLLCLGLYMVFLIFHDNFEFQGLRYDDGIYLQGAKSLALGFGYTMPSFPEHPPIIKYPPLFSFLLSWVWLINPNYPENISLLKLVPIAFSLGGMYLAYRLFSGSGLGSPLIPTLMLCAMGTNYFMINEFTSFMTESLYLCLSLWTLLLAHKAQAEIQENDVPLKKLMPLILVSALTFYARSFGLVLIGIVGVWLAGTNGWQIAKKYLTASFILCLPWIAWVTYQQGNNPFFKPYVYDHFIMYTYLESYTEWFKTYWQYSPDPLAMIAANTESIFLELGRLFLAKLSDIRLLNIIFSSLFVVTLLGKTFFAIRAKKLDLILCYVLSYLGVCLIWPDSQQANRFLVAIFPCLLYLMQTFLQSVFSQKVVTLILAIVLSGVTLGNLDHYRHFLEIVPATQKKYAANIELFNSVVQTLKSNTGPQDIILTERYPFYMLHLDRQMHFYNAVPSPETTLSRKDFAAQVMLSKVMNIKHTGATFILDDLHLYDQLIGSHIVNAEQIFASPDGEIKIYKLFEPVH